MTYTKFKKYDFFSEIEAEGNIKLEVVKQKPNRNHVYVFINDEIFPIAMLANGSDGGFYLTKVSQEVIPIGVNEWKDILRRSNNDS